MGTFINAKTYNINMKKLYLAFLFSILLISFCSASLGSFKQNDMVNIRVLANCSSIDLVEVTNGANVYIINSAMTNLGGQTFSYNFTDTTTIGTYTYSWDNPCIDCSAGDCGNSFEITPSGFANTLGFYFVLILIIGAFIVLGFSVKDGWFVVFGGMAMIALGLYSVNNGIAGFKDTFITWGTSIFLIGVGAYLAINAALEIISSTD